MNFRLGLLLAALTLVPSFASAQELYDSLCASCHGATGEGDGPGIPAGVIRPRPFRAAAFKFDTDADWQRGTDLDIANVIKNGALYYGGSALMPPWPTLSEDDLAGLVQEIRGFSQ